MLETFDQQSNCSKKQLKILKRLLRDVHKQKSYLNKII